MAVYTPEQLGIKAPSGGFQLGGWYSGRQFWGGTLGDPGQFHPQSDQVKQGQTQAYVAPENQAYIQQEISANQMQAPVSVPYTTGAQEQYIGSLNSEVDKARKALERNLASQQTKTQAHLEAARVREKEALVETEKLTTPFREEIEKTERERLKTDEVLTQQKTLLGELDQLLTEGNELIRQQREVTGLQSVRNPRIQKTMDDIAARVSVINAVVSLQNTYLANAYQSIDRSVNAISQDRRDRLTYYETILNLANRDIISLDAESKKIAQEQRDLLKSDLTRTQEIADYIKKLMVDPSTAQLIGEAGVSLNDSVESINKKLGDAQYAREVKEQANEITLKGGGAVTAPTSVPANQLASFTDSRGQVHHYKMGKTVDGTVDLETYIKETYGNGAVLGGKSTATPPAFSPSGGTGTVYQDAQGIMWKYTASGWGVL